MFNRKSKEKEGEKELQQEKLKKTEELGKEKIEELKKEIEKYKLESEEWKNKFFRSFADIDNLRKSLEKERSDIYKYRLDSFLEDFVDVLYAFDTAFQFEIDENDKRTKSFLTNFQSLYKNILKILYKEGVQEINPSKGDDFDPSTMKIYETVFQEGGNDDNNKVIETKYKGYKLADKLIRPASVIVSTNKKNS